MKVQEQFDHRSIQGGLFWDHVIEKRALGIFNKKRRGKTISDLGRKGRDWISEVISGDNSDLRTLR